MAFTFPRALRPIAAVVCASLLVAACGSTNPTPAPASGPPAGACATNTAPATIDGWGTSVKATGTIPQIISSQLVCGQNRVLFGFTQFQKDSTGQQVAVSVGAPDRTGKITFYDLGKDPTKPVSSADGTFMW